MAWSTPHTWATGEVPQAHGDHTDAAGAHSDVADDANLSFNFHIRDNMRILVTAYDTISGRFQALSATYLASLSGANLTGVQLTASANAMTAKNNYNSGSGRVVMPAGANKYNIDSHTDHTDGAHTDTGVKTAGSLWTEDTHLHWVNNINVEYRNAGVQVTASSPGVPGSIWVVNNDIHYVSASGDERYVPGTSSGKHTDAAALAGSIWMETHLHWIQQSSGVERDGTHADSHDDVAHGDVAHSDSHTDTSHTDSHQDTAHTDSHTDSIHIDAHGDNHNDHVDGVHSDNHSDFHNDTAHNDAHSDISHGDTHNDVAHGDAHTDTHTDNAHQDAHFDATPELIGVWP